MFSTVNFKKDALEKLKGNWTVPCLITLAAFAIMTLANCSSYVVNETAGSLITIFLSGTTILAYTEFFVNSYKSGSKLGFADFINGFSDFIKGTLAFLWMILWITLWSILFVIPGIIKAIAYSQMFHVISENPKIGVIKAMKISKIMTQGHKADLFILWLSFIGWDILSMFTGFILQIWIIPYRNMAVTSAYFYLKEEAFRTGILTPADFE